MLEWKNQFDKLLSAKISSNASKALFKKYKNAFPVGYIADFPPRIALSDIEFLEKLSAENPLEVQLYIAKKSSVNNLHFRLYQWNQPLALSDVLPMLENFNLKTIVERPYQIYISKNKNVWINDFNLEYTQKTYNFKKIKDLFESAFKLVFFGESENDGFNKLIISAHLSWREVIILRIYAKYLHQIRFPYSEIYIEKALVNNALVSKNLIRYFYALHDPKAKLNAKLIKKQILAKLEQIPDLDEDTIIRKMLELIKATVRTNYFQRDKNKQIKSYISFKFNSHLIKDLPLPRPLFETYIYSNKFEGIHLRNAHIARGGLRWSDRPQDYRTEVLGLMKAQVVKNSVIVPSGAKGGFVLKKLKSNQTREDLYKEVAASYTLFISGLLDITDNVINGKYIAPPDVVCHDTTDPYLVVAADKGTATFSDLANNIAKEYNFWLGDAFASGGSMGYDHKKMGITARGAWESVKRHFRELEINLQNSLIRVIGIGDMSGDVFGNGMLYSNNIKLIAAFDHRHIFIDPNPDPKKSYNERLRLFKLSGSTWEDYKGISPGGGVFKRSLKSIQLTPQIKEVLNINVDYLSPSETIKAILKAPVDLLFNGGIGTYVKASNENNLEVGDKFNDTCRINGNELRVKVVGEGGNLGFTQRGRIEYALNGGLIFTDFIDNSAGVDCSDHEVNLKILLNEVIRDNKLTYNARNKLLSSLTNEIAELVLEDNYQQALALSFAAFSAKEELTNHADFIRSLEAKNLLNRKVEFLPLDKELLERKVASIGLSRPELAVLLAYTKIQLKQEILKSNLPENSSVQALLESAFPKLIKEKYKKEMYNHQLRRHIISTQLANEVVNNTGISFVYQTQMETGATVEDIIKAYYIVSNIFETNQLQRVVDELDSKISLSEQFDIITNIHNLVKLSIRWFLQETKLNQNLEGIISRYKNLIKILEKVIPDIMGGETKKYLNSLTEKFQTLGLSKAIGKRIATYRAIYTSLNIIKVATKHNLDIVKTAKIYFASGEELNLLWFRDKIANDHHEGYWNILARLSLRNELDTAQRALTIAILKSTPNNIGTHQRISLWKNNNKNIMKRWDNIIAMLHNSATQDYSMFFIVVREFIRLISALKN